MQGYINIQKSVKVIQCINRRKKKKHVSTLLTERKEVDKIQHLQQDRELGKSIYRKPTASIILNGEIMNGSPLV